MDAVGGHHVKRSKSASGRLRLYVFSHMWKIDPKGKSIHKNKHGNVHTYAEHVCNSGTTLWNSGEEGREKGNDSVFTISQYVTCVQVGAKDVY
jgi:hypothetical protein